MNRYPYDEELQKKPLNSEMIRYRVEEGERSGLAIHFFLVPAILFGSGGIIVFLFSLLPEITGNAAGTAVGTVGVILLALLALALPVGEAVFLAQSIRDFRRAKHGELLIEIDTVDHIEYDRPRKVRTHSAHRTVYEDFRHFASGREFQDECHPARDAEGDAFITVAYAAEPEHILFIYRLSDYNWQG